MNTHTFLKSLLAAAIAIHPFYAGAQTRPHNAARTTSDSLLLISHASDYYETALGFVHVDSTTFSYSSGRGTNKHDVQSYYRFDTSATGYSLDWRKTNSFDAANNITGYIHDDWGGAVPWPFRTFYTYDASGDLVTLHCDFFNNTTSAWENDYEQTYTYTATHKLATLTEISWYLPTIPPHYTVRVACTYDASDNVATELQQGWSGVAWMNTARYNYSYDSHNNMVVNYAELWDGLGMFWAPWGWDSSAYDAADNKIHSERREVWSTTDSAWRVFRLGDYSGFIAHQPQLILTQVWEPLDSSFHNDAKIINTYNSQAKIEYTLRQSWNDTTSAWELMNADYQHRYHYANVAAAVPDVELPANGSINIFPVPAKDALTIDLEWKEPQPFTISIIDMMGRVCGTWNVPSRAKHSEAISLHYLAAGNYIIKAVGAKASASRRVTIEK